MLQHPMKLTPFPNPRNAPKSYFSQVAGNSPNF